MASSETISQNAWTADNWKRRFFTIWSGQAFSLLGSTLVQFALVWWLTSTTGSATVLATATLVALLPQVFLSPFAGALVDRWNRRVVMIVADSIIAAFSVLLAFLFYTGSIQIWHIYAVMLIRSAGGAFQWPAMQASTSLMVPEKNLSRVAGMNQMLQGVMSVAAPPLGALLLSVAPMQIVLLVDVVTAAIAVLPLFVIHIPQPARAATGKVTGGSMLADMRAGLHYVLGWRALLIISFMATIINFLVTPAFSLLPILVTKHFGGAALQLSMMNSAEGIGLIAGGLLLSVWGGFKKKVYTSMTGLVGMGIGIVLLGLAPTNMWLLALASMLLAGMANPITNGPLFAILQAHVAPEMQGRVMSLLGAASAAVSPLSLLIAGPVSDAIGVQAWYVVGGAVCVLMGVVGAFIPSLGRMEDERVTAQAAVGSPVQPVSVADQA